MTLRSFRLPDQYYRLTAHLTTHGQQRRTTRAIAATVLALSLLVALVTLSRVGPSTTWGKGVNATVALSGVVMSTIGLRHRWPTRAESQWSVILGSAFMGAVCLSMSDPMVGLLTGAVFAVASAYTAAFHSLRLLSAVWVFAAATIIALAARMIQDDAIAALCAALLVVLINVLVALLARLVVHALKLDTEHGNVEPTTGLLDAHGLHERVAALIDARTRWDDRHLFVVAVSVDGIAALTGHGAAAVHQARLAAAHGLRQTVRQGALLAHLNASDYVVAEISAASDPTPLVERIQQSMRSSPVRLGCSVGAVSTPVRSLNEQSSTDVIDELVDRAFAGCEQARAGGAHAYHVSVAPTLNTLKADPDR